MKPPISWHFVQFQTATHKIILLCFKASFQRKNLEMFPFGGQGVKSPEAEGFFFLNLRFDKNPFPGTLSSFK